MDIWFKFDSFFYTMPRYDSTFSSTHQKINPLPLSFQTCFKYSCKPTQLSKKTIQLDELPVTVAEWKQNQTVCVLSMLLSLGITCNSINHFGHTWTWIKENIVHGYLSLLGSEWFEDCCSPEALKYHTQLTKPCSLWENIQIAKASLISQHSCD